MTKPCNIYLLSRISDADAFDRVKTHACGEGEAKKTPYHEIRSLGELVDGLLKEGVDTKMLDGFFQGYQIPRIGKEFDLLKFKKNECLSIEIKSVSVPKREILDQLLKNRHYLSHLGRKVEFYTVVTDTLTSYRLTDNNTLETVDFSVVADAVKRFSNDFEKEIDDMFGAGDYLVSPLSTPEKFIKDEYFLTQAQDFIKKRILADIQSQKGKGFYSILGTPGTGKTLLLYDIAKSLSKSAKTMVIHWGKLFGAEEKLNREIQNFRVITLNDLSDDPKIISDYQNILVDEAHRMSPQQFFLIKNSIKTTSQICIFSSDPEQVLTQHEKKNAIHKKIMALPLSGRYKLSEKIRVNKQLASFIASVRNLNLKPNPPMKYDDVSLCYAHDENEAERIIDYYRQKGYVFINYAKSKTLSHYKEDFLAQHVVGQEFDNVLMMLDGSFYYDGSGKLKGMPYQKHEYIYPNLFYQGITRVREKLALVVVGAPKLFNKISTVVDDKPKNNKRSTKNEHLA